MPSFDTYQLLGYRVSVGAAHDARVTVRNLLRGFAPILSVDLPTQRCFELTTQDAAWRVHVDRQLVHEGDDFSVALGVLEWRIVTAALEHRRDLFHLHGAALIDPRRAGGIVLSGDSGAGKTTMTLALMRHGFIPLADDITLIDPERFELQPFPRAFHVDGETARVVECAGGTPPSFHPAPPGYAYPARWADRPAPIRWMLFVEYRAGEPSRLTPMTPADAAAAMLGRTLTLSSSPRMALSTAARLTERAACYRFVSSDLGESVRIVERLIDADRGGLR